MEQLQSQLPLAALLSCADEACVCDCIAPVALADLQSKLMIRYMMSLTCISVLIRTEQVAYQMHTQLACQHMGCI